MTSSIKLMASSQYIQLMHCTQSLSTVLFKTKLDGRYVQYTNIMFIYSSPFCDLSHTISSYFKYYPYYSACNFSVQSTYIDNSPNSQVRVKVTSPIRRTYSIDIWLMGRIGLIYFGDGLNSTTSHDELIQVTESYCRSLIKCSNS